MNNPKSRIAFGVVLIALKIIQFISQWPVAEPSAAYFWDGVQFALGGCLIYSGFRPAKAKS